MNWLDHEYLVPIIIGNNNEAVKAAKRIYRKTGFRPQIFAERFSAWQRLLYHCHVVSPMKDDFIVMSLLDFSKSLEEYFYPVIIVCDDNSRRFVEKNEEALESLFLIRSVDI